MDGRRYSSIIESNRRFGVKYICLKAQGQSQSQSRYDTTLVEKERKEEREMGISLGWER